MYYAEAVSTFKVEVFPIIQRVFPDANPADFWGEYLKQLVRSGEVLPEQLQHENGWPNPYTVAAPPPPRDTEEHPAPAPAPDGFPAIPADPYHYGPAGRFPWLPRPPRWGHTPAGLLTRLVALCLQPAPLGAKELRP